jgi:hypothetical protein
MFIPPCRNLRQSFAKVFESIGVKYNTPWKEAEENLKDSDLYLESDELFVGFFFSSEA